MSDDQMMEIKSRFEGSWKLDKSENFEAFLREIGVHFILSKLAGLTKPTSDINVDGEQISITYNSGLVNKTNTFKLGEEYESEVQGNKSKILVTYEDGKLVTDSKPFSEKFKPQTLTRERVGDQLLSTMCAGDVVCKQYFKRM